MADEARLAVVQAKLEDIRAVDFQWSLMVAALSSYKHDSVLRPFPPMFATDGSDFKDYARMEKTIMKCPSFVKLRSYLQQCQATNKTPAVDSQLLELLHWVTQPRNFKLQSCGKEKFSLITELTGQEIPVTPPNHVFELHYSDSSNEKFEERRGDKDIIYAVHGSRVENFHSILNNGLQGHMSKVALFGEGIYLSGELSVSMPYAPTGAGWEKSSLGDRLSCFAVCQVIDDERYVKCNEKDPSPSTNGINGRPIPKTSSRARIDGAEGGDIPEKYYVVRNNDFLRVKYVLVYAEQSKSKRAPETWMHWFKEHKFVVMLVVYILLLVFVGLYSSPTFHARIKRYLRKR